MKITLVLFQEEYVRIKFVIKIKIVSISFHTVTDTVCLCNTDAIFLREREVAKKSTYLGCFSTSLFSKQPILEISIKGMF